jgi:tetratricopeptide (TPR) repeat protein
MERKKFLRAIVFLFISMLIVNPGILGKADAASRSGASSAQQPGESQKQADSQLLINKGEEFARLKQYDQAIKAFKQAITLQPQLPEGYVRLATALLSNGQSAEALATAKQAIQIDPNYAPAYVGLGNVNELMRRYSEAIEAYRQATRLNPSYFNAHMCLGNVLGMTGRYEESAESFEQALKLNSNHAGAYNGLGIAYFRLGHQEEGIAALKQAVRLDPNFANAYTNLGNYYNQLGRYEEASESFGDVVRIAPKFPGGYFNRGINLMNAGHGGAAADDARTFLDLTNWHNERSQYMVIVAVLGYKAAGRDADENKILGLAAKRCNSTEWPYPVIQYLSGDLTTQALLALATDNDRMTEARAYLGLDLSIGGRREEALEQLRWVKANGNKRFIEYPFALSEINRIERGIKKTSQ